MKYDRDRNKNAHLPAINAQTDGIDKAWSGSNEQWWNWYISLADNSQEPIDREDLIPRAEPVEPKVYSIE